MQSPNGEDQSINLGKLSLKARLEAYYSLISPETIASPVEWKKKFDQIFDKYGGSFEGECKLASKLRKKYGAAVRLLVAQQPPTANEKEQILKNISDEGLDESWYILRSGEKNSGDFGFVSSRFDPYAALAVPEVSIVKRNPWLTRCSRLDTVGQFALHLPKEDPLRIEPLKSRKRASTPNADGGIASKAARELHPFDYIDQSMGAGPLSHLQRFRRQRVRITIRYVNAIRGILTGILVAFDKHMNIILRDVEETYSSRPSRSGKSNIETELDRQHKLSGKIALLDGEWVGRKRRMKHLLVRGDNIVLISKADEEKATTQSLFSKRRY